MGIEISGWTYWLATNGVRIELEDGYCYYQGCTDHR